MYNESPINLGLERVIIVQTTNIENTGINLYDYIMKNYEMYFDMTPYRNMELNYILGVCNARAINLESFKEFFNLQGASFFDILKFVVNASNLECIASYGKMCFCDVMECLTSQTISTGMHL